MPDRYSCTVLIETDGDPAVVIAALRDAYAVAAQVRGYVGPAAVLRFSPPLHERDAH